MTFNLFDRGPLQQDTGLIAERWGQDGNTAVSTTAYYDANGYIYDVPTGKTFYVTDVTFQLVVADTGTSVVNICDFNPASPKLYVDTSNYALGSIIVFNFKTPLKFTAGVYWYANSGTYSGPEGYLTMSGWEE